MFQQNKLGWSISDAEYARIFVEEIVAYYSQSLSLDGPNRGHSSFLGTQIPPPATQPRQPMWMDDADSTPANYKAVRGYWDKAIPECVKKIGKEEALMKSITNHRSVVKSLYPFEQLSNHSFHDLLDDFQALLGKFSTLEK